MNPRNDSRNSIRNAAFVLVLASAAVATAGDWPTYRGDISRSGATDESIAAPLHIDWVYRAPAAPELAWSSAEGRVIEGKLLGHRVKYDDALHPVVVGDRAYFGSTVDDQLYCVDLTTGEVQWTFFAGAPIRLAPTVAEGRVYFGADDGRAYCLDANTGERVWQLRAGPADEWLLARGEMINRWPVRTGVLVDDGVAYFGAGIFPHEDIYLYAVNATDGSVIWKADNISAADAGRNDLSPQGYLLASDDRLFVPSGRSMPAAIDRNDGSLVFKKTYSWRSTAGGVVGGTRALLADGQVYATGPHHLLAIDQNDGNVGFGWFEGRQLVVHGDAAYTATGSFVARLNRMEYAVNSRRRHTLETEIYNLSRQLRSPGDNADELREKLTAASDELKAIADVGFVWKQETESDSSLLAAGDKLFVGGKNLVTAYAASDGEDLWSAEIPGDVRGLVVAGGRLLVSTDQGHIYCYAPGEGETAIPPADAIAESPYADDEWTARYEQAAEEILKQTGVETGFCLVVGGEEGRLAYELARRSGLEIYCVEPDADKAATAREKLSAAGLYGYRVTVHNFDLGDIPYANYFANLVVSDTLLKTGEIRFDPEQVARFVKPVGGVLCLGRPQSLEPIAAKQLTEWLDRTGLKEESEAAHVDGWALLTRGELPGAGDWSHQYGNPANTAISNDTRVEGGLGVLWYGDPGPGEMVNRHEGAVGPLSVNGRLFVQGQTTIKAYDAYNGVHLWTYENEEAIRTGVFQNQAPGNLAADETHLFHFLADKCYQLNAATGELEAVHELPEGKNDGKFEWGYLAAQDGILFGTATMRPELESRLRRRGRVTDDATDSIFAIDLASGEHLWTYQGQNISHHTIAIGDGRVFFIDSSISSEEREEILRQDKSELANLTGEARERAEERAKNADVRTAVAIDARSGEKLWSEGVDVTDCSDIGIGGGKLTLMYQDGVLILCGANANGHYWRQFVAGEFERRRLVALSADDGYKIWAKDANYRHRPIIIGEHVLAEPWMFDLKTGDQITRAHPITGEDVPWSIMRTGHHCGMLTGCDSGMIMFRSGDTGFFDLDSDEGVRHFAGHRLGCWINAIPANGLVMIPEASAGCVCQFSIAATIVLEPREPRRPWTIYSAVGAQTPVQHLAVNLGAPGDRKAADGTVWLSYPRYRAYQETALDVKLDLAEQFTGGGGFRSVSDASTPVDGTDVPWIYTSWAEGLTQLTLPLVGEGDSPATYTIRLHFADPRDAEAATSVFDVAINGTTVQEGVSVTRTPETAATAQVVEIPGVEVSGSVTIAINPREGTPLLNAVEAVRED